MMLSNLFLPPKINWQKKYQLKLERNPHELLTSFYQAPLPSPDTPLDEVTFLAIDLETTGLNTETDDIISIGVVPFTLQRIYLSQAKEWLVKPREKLTEESVIIHGITHSDVSHAPDFSAIMSELLKTMEGKVMVAHYRDIERQFLDKEFMARLDEGIEFPIVDTMELEERIIKKNHSSVFKLFSSKKPSLRLGIARQRYGLPNYPSHNALTDAIAAAELLQAQITHYFSPSIPIDHLWK